MRIMAEKIISAVDIKMPQAAFFYVDKERIVNVENVSLKIILSQNDFDRISHEQPLQNSESIDWIKRCIVGHIKKAELDEARKNETNALDMMQNSSIIYHPESLLEM